MNEELLSAIRSVAHEKNIDEEIIFDTLKASLLSVCRRHWGYSNFDVEIDKESGEIKVFTFKKVLDKVLDKRYEISVEDAQEFSPNCTVGETLKIEVEQEDFGRIAAQTAKQVVSQKFLEIERDSVYQEMLSRKNKIITGMVQSFENGNLIVNLGKIEVVLLKREQVPGEEFNLHDRIKVYVVDVKRHPKGVTVLISRSHPDFVRALFVREIPEVYSGVVKIVNIVREAGKRCKVAVLSEDPDIEAIGSCIGEHGCRINIISRELRKEKIDLINWYEDIREYISSALSPSRIVDVRLNADSTCALVVVEDNQISLAIGKSGQNVRLASKLTNMRLDIKTETQVNEQIDSLKEYFPDLNLSSNDE